MECRASVPGTALADMKPSGRGRTALRRRPRCRVPVARACGPCTVSRVYTSHARPQSPSREGKRFCQPGFTKYHLLLSRHGKKTVSLYSEGRCQIPFPFPSHLLVSLFFPFALPPMPTPTPNHHHPCSRGPFSLSGIKPWRRCGDGEEAVCGRGREGVGRCKTEWSGVKPADEDLVVFIYGGADDM